MNASNASAAVEEELTKENSNTSEDEQKDSKAKQPMDSQSEESVVQQ